MKKKEGMHTKLVALYLLLVFKTDGFTNDNYDPNRDIAKIASGKSIYNDRIYEEKEANPQEKTIIIEAYNDFVKGIQTRLVVDARPTCSMNRLTNIYSDMYLTTQKNLPITENYSLYQRSSPQNLSENFWTIYELRPKNNTEVSYFFGIEYRLTH